jgi:hypothetical protein
VKVIGFKKEVRVSGILFPLPGYIFKHGTTESSQDEKIKQATTLGGPTPNTVQN